MKERFAPFFGGRLCVHPLAPLTPALMIWAEGWETAMLLFAAAFWHEVGHWVMLRCFGAPITQVRLTPSGAMIHYPQIRDEAALAVALGGIAFNLFGAFSAAVLLCIWRNAGVLLFLVFNLFLALGNALPMRRNDGSEAIRFFCTLRGKNPAALLRRLSVLSTVAAAALTVILFACGGGNPSVFLMFVLFVLPE